jgi:hypothetical protein
MTNPTLRLENGKGRVEYIGGPHPYYWIGNAKGSFVGAVDAATLKTFVNAPLKWAERPVTP